MTAEQQRKAANAIRRAVAVAQARSQKPDSKQTFRKRFERAHDGWREIVGLEPVRRNK